MDEKKRLDFLYKLNILDTDYDEEYDSVTKFLKDIFDIPIVLVSLVDLNRQWFKSCIGLEDRETHRSLSFCSNAIKREEKLYIIEDTLETDLYKNNALVTGPPNIRFYAGCVINIPNKKDNYNYKLGSICIIDNKPRKINEKEKEILLKAGEMIENIILKQYYDEKNKLEQKNKIIKIKNRIKPIKTFIELLRLNNDNPHYKNVYDMITENVDESCDIIDEICECKDNKK